MHSAWRPVSRKELADAGARERRDKLQRRRRRRRGVHDHRVLHGAVALQRRLQRGDRRRLLADGDVDAVDRLLARLVRPLLVQDGVDQDRRLARLAVADDELALAAADGHHRVDGLDPGLERLRHGLAVDHARRLALDGHLEQLARDRPLAVERVAERVDDAAQHPLAHLDRRDPVGPARLVALLDGVDLAEEHGADVVLLQVEDHPGHARLGKVDELAGLDLGEPVEPGDAVADLEHGADLVGVGLGGEVAQLLAEHGGHFVGADRGCHVFRCEGRKSCGGALAAGARV